MRDSSICDAVIAGARPVGLFLACELRLGGVTPAKERTGQADSSANAQWMQQARRPGGHFAGIQFFHDKIDASRWVGRLTGVMSGPLPTSMERLESVLAARAVAMGVEMRLGKKFEQCVQTEGAVTIDAGGASVRARWLIGCDGARRAVRKTGGFEFVGTDPEFTGYSVEVEMASSDALPAGRHDTPTGMYTYQRPGTIAMVDFDEGAIHRTESITLEHSARSHSSRPDRDPGWRHLLRATRVGHVPAVRARRQSSAGRMQHSGFRIE